MLHLDVQQDQVIVGAEIIQDFVPVREHGQLVSAGILPVKLMNVGRELLLNILIVFNNGNMHLLSLPGEYKLTKSA